MSAYIPDGYVSTLNIKDTQVAIKKIKDFFERDLAMALNLTRVSAPLFVNSESGLNDNLNGVERPVCFDIHSGENIEIVHSLAKWKRLALREYGFKVGIQTMTGLPEATQESDLQTAKTVCKLSPDFVRVYPTVVVRDTKDEYRIIPVQEWIENDDSLTGVFGY